MKVFKAVKQAGKDFSDDECLSSGAALAYYTIFALPPLLVIVMVVAGWFGVEHSSVDRVVKEQLGLPMSQTPADPSVPRPAGGAASGIVGLDWGSRIVGVLILIFSATGLFAQLQRALNRAWEVEPDPEQGSIMQFAVKRLLSLGMVLVIAFLLLVSFVLSTMVEQIGRWLSGPAPETAVLWLITALNIAVTLLLATLLFAAMFKILPDATTSWRDLFVGAGITAVLFVVGKTAIGFYLQYARVGSTWGNAAASLVAVLVWVYYSSLIVLFGAELAQVWANQYGSGMQPSSGAVKVVEEKSHVRDEPGRRAVKA